MIEVSFLLHSTGQGTKIKLKQISTTKSRNLKLKTYSMPLIVSSAPFRDRLKPQDKNGLAIYRLRKGFRKRNLKVFSGFETTVLRGTKFEKT